MGATGLLTALLAACAEAQGDPGAGAPPVARDALTTALELARRDHPHLDAAAAEAAVEALAARYRELLPADATPRQRAEAFATLFFDDQGYVAVDDLTSPEVLHVDTVLQRRTGHCLSLSVLALAVAERVGEPLFAVAMPNHVFARYDDGELRRNLELTRGGVEVTDAELRARMGDFLRDDSLYLTNLDRLQLRGLLLHDRGFVALEQGRADDALADFTEALLCAPRLPEAHRNLGVLHGEQRRWKPAIAALERAVELYPGDLDALLNLALCRHADGDVTGALADLDVVELLAPGHPRAAELRPRWVAEAGHGAGAHGVRGLDDPPPGLVSGLRGRYFRGIAFDTLVREQVDTDLDFDWQRGPPARGVPADRFSVRWTGWFRADRPGRYTLFVVANDGARIRFGDRTAVDRWHEVGHSSWTDRFEIELPAGWHPLTVEHFDASTNARLFCLVGREGDEYPLELPGHLFHQR